MALPDAAAGHPAVVVIGFTHSSQNQTKAWAARLQHEFPTYSIAVLENAPRLVRGMAVHGMKRRRAPGPARSFHRDLPR
jgi:hypothetical protein